MKARHISEAPHDGSLQLVAEGHHSCGPFYGARFLHNQWILEGTGNVFIEPDIWLEIDRTHQLIGTVLP